MTIPTKRILVVEDDAILLQLCHMQLTRLGFDVEAVNDPILAIEKAVRSQYFLILLDLQLPHLNGLEIAQRIRALETKDGITRVPIIGMSAYPQHTCCLEAGMDDFLLKPIKLEHLRKLIDKWFKTPG